MKLHADPLSALTTVTAYGPGFVEINRKRYSGHLLIAPESVVEAWAIAGFDALTPEDFKALLSRKPDVVLIGTGARQRFVHPRLTAALAAARVGVEAMDTAAACRTYNILMSEGRRVLAGLLQDQD